MSKRIQKHLRKEELLQSALKVFVHEGLGKASLRSIAKDARVSPSLILHHFGNLNNLFLEVVLKVVQDGRSISVSYMNGLSDANDLIKAYVEAMFDWLGLNTTNQIIYLQFYHYAIFNKDFNKLNISIVMGGRTRISGILNLGVEQNIFKIKNIEMTTKAIQDLLTGTFFRMAATQGLYNPQIERSELYLEVLDLIHNN